jgi:REP element-mobilizing transposase RayT
LSSLLDNIGRVMPRKPRIEIANRRKIFRSHDDYLRFTAILQLQKSKLPFYLYAYCLMPNHFHLLVEMQDDPISRVMHGFLTAYSQYHNREYKNVDCLFQTASCAAARQDFALAAVHDPRSLCSTL